MSINGQRKVLLTGASLSSTNLGINALTIGAVTAVLKALPGAHIELFNQNSYEDYKEEHLIQIAGKRLRICENHVWSSKYIICGLLHSVFFFLPGAFKRFLFIRMLPVYYLPFFLLRPSWRRKRVEHSGKTLNKLTTCDILINLAEGDSFSDIYGIHVFLRHCLDKLISISYKRKTVIFPQTIGPFNGTCAKLLARRVISGADRVYVREDMSRKHIRERFGETGNIEDACDMAFLMEPEKVKCTGLDRFAEGALLAGVNVSGFLYRGGSGSGLVASGSDYPSLSEAIVRHLLKLDRRIKVVFISHVTDQDLPANRDIMEKLEKEGFKGRMFILRGGYTAPQIKYILGRLSFFTGARMHACIGSLSSNIPTVPQAYSYKFAGITEKLGLGEYVADLRSDSQEMILQKISDCFKNRRSISVQLRKKIPEMKRNAMKCTASLQD